MTDNITIRHRYTDAVLLEYQPTAEQQASGFAMLAALETAVACGANLRRANLEGVNLSWVNLDRANLEGSTCAGPICMGPIWAVSIWAWLIWID